MQEVVWLEGTPVAKRVNVADAVARKRDEQVAKGECLGCDRKVADARYRCGLCPSCYQAVNRAVSRGAVTRSELMREGKLLPKSKGGRKPRLKLSVELSKR